MCVLMPSPLFQQQALDLLQHQLDKTRGILDITLAIAGSLNVC